MEKASVLSRPPEFTPRRLRDALHALAQVRAYYVELERVIADRARFARELRERGEAQLPDESRLDALDDETAPLRAMPFSDVARLTGVPVATINTWRKRGLVRAFRAGRDWRVVPRDVIECAYAALDEIAVGDQ